MVIASPSIEIHVTPEAVIARSRAFAKAHDYTLDDEGLIGLRDLILEESSRRWVGEVDSPRVAAAMRGWYCMVNAHLATLDVVVRLQRWADGVPPGCHKLGSDIIFSGYGISRRGDPCGCHQ